VATPWVILSVVRPTSQSITLLLWNITAAQAIAVRDKRGEANTEELRKAVVHYRDLFDELLEVRETKQGVMSAK